MKKRENIRKNKIILLFCVIIFIIFIIQNSGSLVYALQEENMDIADNEILNQEISIEELVQKNTQAVKKEIISKQEIDLEYTTHYQENPQLPKGTIQVLQEGNDGKQEIILKRVYENDLLQCEEQMGTQITKASVDRIVQVGTSPYISNYKVKIGDEMFVTSSLLPVRVEPKEESQKLITLQQQDKITLLEINGQWYKISYGNYIGWVKSDCVTYINYNEETKQSQSENTYTKEQLQNNLNFNMLLNKPSGLSLEQFKKVFSNNKEDRNNIFKENAQYFYYIEKQYNINGIFVAAVGIHESNWGTSNMAKNKKNLFGYGAYDRNPSDNAYVFSSYSEGIDLLARVFTKYYLNPRGTKIYGEEIATGSHYNGSTVSGVNKKYASDKNWANGVYKWMSYLYNKL